jgi:hypothetical protein
MNNKMGRRPTPEEHYKRLVLEEFKKHALGLLVYDYNLKRRKKWN